jgi:HEAT repeat protein
MASELLGLGDPLGRETLIKLCHDMTVPGSARMAAANDLVGFNDNSCLDSVFNTLQSPTDLHDTVAKEDALELAPELIRHFGPQRYPAVLQLVINSLRDPWPSNRTRASQVLVQIGDPAAIPNLEAAIAEEKDATRRSIMTESLRDLKAKNQRR